MARTMARHSCHRSAATYRRYAAIYCRSAATYSRSAATYLRSVAAHGRSAAIYRNSAATYRKSAATYRTSAATCRKLASTDRESPVTDRMFMVTYRMAADVLTWSSAATHAHHLLNGGGRYHLHVGSRPSSLEGGLLPLIGGLLMLLGLPKLLVLPTGGRSWVQPTTWEATACGEWGGERRCCATATGELLRGGRWGGLLHAFLLENGA